MATKTPKNDNVKRPWAAKPGEYADVKPRKLTAEQKKANDDFNEYFGLTKPKKPAAKKTTKKK